MSNKFGARKLFSGLILALQYGLPKQSQCLAYQILQLFGEIHKALLDQNGKRNFTMVLTV